MSQLRIYLDNSATTQVDTEVLNAMLPLFCDAYGNPNSLHKFGRDAHKLVEIARGQVASLINADPEEIIFTGSGSEADNLAIKGTAFALSKKGKHIITSAIEHHALLNSLNWLQEIGFDYTILPVNRQGIVDPKELKKAIKPDTILASVMYGNNEIGTIEPIAELGAICREKGVLFHTDAVQAAGHVKIDVKKIPVDLMSMAAHKMYGPKGIGALFLRKGLELTPIIHGGGQESGKRAGTENTPAIVGFGAAAEKAVFRLSDGTTEKIKKLRDKLINGLLEKILEIELAGHREKRLPFHASFCVKYIEGESMLLLLDSEGIAASSASACSAGNFEPSHVLLACGYDHISAHGSLRFTLSCNTTDEDIDRLLLKFPPIVEKLRAISPFYSSK